MLHAVLALSAALSFSAAHAGTLAGVTLPDTAQVGGQSLVLNGMGLREKYMIDVYVGGLYLPAKSGDAARAIQDDVPKRIVMHFQRGLDKDDLVGSLREGFAKAKADPTKVKQLEGMLGPVSEGDQIILDYVPGAGTTVKIKGASKGTVAGADFMHALWGIYLGANPPTAALKKGMMGG